MWGRWRGHYGAVIVGTNRNPIPPCRLPAVDAAFQEFLDNHEVLDGISYVLVDKEGTTHTAVFGDHTEDLVTILASTSKVPAVMAILALDDDPSVDFSISEPVSEYLPFGGIYADRTVEQMISNTSGIPGLRVTPLKLLRPVEFTAAKPALSRL